ncbi:MAG: hypothetical protein JNL64_08775 [Blastocatellia bacterium]|nr:hypothetical protein [Blastocatellia bacterium]
MKKNLILAAVAVFAFAMAASAQEASFAGSWTLDVAKSKIAGPPIESQTLVITQTATEIKVEQTTKRGAPPAGAPQGPPPGGGGGGRGGMMGGGDGTTTYSLDGKAVKSQMQTPRGSMDVLTTAKLDGSKIEITRVISTPMGEISTTEKWTLGTDGTLTIESQRPNRDGGTDTTTRVFTKK